jgi:hypothetical protein
MNNDRTIKSMQKAMLKGFLSAFRKVIPRPVYIWLRIGKAQKSKCLWIIGDEEVEDLPPVMALPGTACGQGKQKQQTADPFHAGFYHIRSVILNDYISADPGNLLSGQVKKLGYLHFQLYDEA